MYNNDLSNSDELPGIAVPDAEVKCIRPPRWATCSPGDLSRIRAARKIRMSAVVVVVALCHANAVVTS